jgi:hypothetical protein
MRMMLRASRDLDHRDRRAQLHGNLRRNLAIFLRDFAPLRFTEINRPVREARLPQIPEKPDSPHSRFPTRNLPESSSAEESLYASDSARSSNCQTDRCGTRDCRPAGDKVVRF